MGNPEGGDAVMEELKEVVTQTLEKKGILAKIRAELRASVFEAIDEQENVSNGGILSQQSERFQKLTASDEGRQVVHLVREFLEWAGLEYSNKVFIPETSIKGDTYPGRKGLVEFLGVAEERGKPVLLSVLEGHLQGGAEHGGEAGTSPSNSQDGGRRSGGRAGAINRLKTGMQDTPLSPEEEQNIFSRARRQAMRSPQEAEEREGRHSGHSEKSHSSHTSPNTSFDELTTSKGGMLGDTGLGVKKGLEPLGNVPAAGSLPPLRGGRLTPLDSLSPKSNSGSIKSFTGRSEKGSDGVGGVNQSQELGRSLELGRSADFSDHYSADFDRDIEEMIEEEELELHHEEEEFSMHAEDQDLHQSSQSFGRSVVGVSMDMMASGLSASDRSGELDLEDSADLIESAEMG